MAYIEGLKESEAALAEIKKILKELESIDTFMSVENPTSLYKLSFTVKNTVSDEPADENGTPKTGAPVTAGLSVETPLTNEVAFIEKGADQEKKSLKRTKKTLQYTTPLICDDKESLYYFIQLYKERKVRTIRQLMDTHRIRLSKEEAEILGDLS